jgi:hypothetical protein
MPNKEKYVEIELLKEPVNIYLLEDDTLLTVRFVVNYILCYYNDDGKIEFKPDHRIVTSSYVPVNLRGEPTKEYLDPRKCIINDNVKIKEVMREDIGIYKLINDSRLMTVSNHVEKVKKTSIFMNNKMPRYLVAGNSDIGFTDAIKPSTKSK